MFKILWIWFWLFSLQSLRFICSFVVICYHDLWCLHGLFTNFSSNLLHSDLTDPRNYFNWHLPKMVMNCKVSLVFFYVLYRKGHETSNRVWRWFGSIKWSHWLLFPNVISDVYKLLFVILYPFTITLVWVSMTWDTCLLITFLKGVNDKSLLVQIWILYTKSRL